MAKLTKYEKETIIRTSEGDSTWEVFTYNTALKKKLLAFSKEHPESCRPVCHNNEGGETYEVEKGRLSIRLTAPYSEERKKAASANAKKHGMKGYQSRVKA